MNIEELIPGYNTSIDFATDEILLEAWFGLDSKYILFFFPSISCKWPDTNGLLIIITQWWLQSINNTATMDFRLY